MREIKFRAWDKKENEWLLGYELPNLGGFSMFGECMLFGKWTEILNSRPLQELDTIELMQYTGLKDKNGKEIYEGDILHHKGINYEVGWLEYKWTIRKATGQSHPFRQIYNWPINFEIIGNIWENPELLK